MKPPPFSYHDPRTVADAVRLLGSLENPKLLAGGQSLMPMLAMRFVLPDHVIDLNKIEGLAYIREANGALEIGGMTRQRDIEFSDLVAAKHPLLREGILNVGHRQTRNRGTIGGSLCHLDPAAEQVLVCMASDAIVTVAGPNGERAIPFREFPLAYMTPALEPDEMLVGIKLPLWPAGHGYCFLEFARRHGDFAVVSAAVLLELDAGGKIKRAAVALGGVAAVPLRMDEVEARLVGQVASEELFREAAELCRAVEAIADVHATVEYRQHLAAVLTRRALVQALARVRRA
ncbi:MAG TPA: xanthine dehydrogenase family protein subunit M [Alphaproteobacteria bacterium]